MKVLEYIQQRTVFSLSESLKSLEISSEDSFPGLLYYTYICSRSKLSQRGPVHLTRPLYNSYMCVAQKILAKRKRDMSVFLLISWNVLHCIINIREPVGDKSSPFLWHTRWRGSLSQSWVYYTTYYSVTVPLMRVADVKAKYKARACFHYTDHLYASINKIFATYFIT